MIRSMTNAHKDKRLVFITPTQRDGYILNGKVTSMTNDIGVNLIQYVDAMIEMCGDYGIPVIDLYRNSGINIVNIPTMLYDGLHPNTDGFLRLGYYIAKQLNNI